MTPDTSKTFPFTVGSINFGTTATTGLPQPLNLAQIKSAVASLEANRALVNPQSWTLIAPDGRVWRSENPKDLAMALAPHVMEGL